MHRPALRPLVLSVFRFYHLGRVSRSQFTCFCTVPPDSFFSSTFLTSVFWSILPCSVSAPVSNLASGVRLIYSHLFPPPYSRAEFVPVGTRCASFIRAVSCSLCLLLGLFLAMLNCLRIFRCLVVEPQSPLGRYFGAHTFSASFWFFAFPTFGSSFGLWPFASVIMV